jgi:hypothetical protein
MRSAYCPMIHIKPALACRTGGGYMCHMRRRIHVPYDPYQARLGLSHSTASNAIRHTASTTASHARATPRTLRHTSRTPNEAHLESSQRATPPKNLPRTPPGHLRQGGRASTEGETSGACSESGDSRFSQRVPMTDSYLLGYLRKTSLMTTMASCTTCDTLVCTTWPCHAPKCGHVTQEPHGKAH